MKILFVIDKLELKYFEFNNLVTNFWLIKEFLENNCEVFVTTINTLGLSGTTPFCQTFKSYLKNGDIFLETESQTLKVETFNLVMFRPDPPVDLDYINATYVLDFVNKEKTLVLNDTKAIRNFNEKLHSNLFNDFMPKNIVTASKEEINNFLEENEQIILKPLNKCFGAGVMFLQKGDKNTNAIINSLTDNQQTLIMVQKYLNNACHGDKRVLLLGGNVLEECVVKLPSEDDFKFNTHSDKFIKKAVLSENEKNKFKKVAEKLNSVGIFMAGLDVIDEQIIEINVTSPCFFIKEINNYFSINLEKRIVKEILEKVKSSNKVV